MAAMQAVPSDSFHKLPDFLNRRSLKPGKLLCTSVTGDPMHALTQELPPGRSSLRASFSHSDPRFRAF